MTSESITLEKRIKKNGHQPALLWLTGLSGAGKSTLAYTLEKKLFEYGFQTSVLDGDDLRTGLCNDLGFSAADRMENIRRAARVAELLYLSGHITIVALISPYREARREARSQISANHFFEIFCDAPLSACIERDTKGLYRKAQHGELKNVTGIDVIYEAPKAAELLLKTAEWSIDDCIEKLLSLLQTNKIIPKQNHQK